ncbi:MAG: AtpZ/AtpI family protein [Azospirillaceae bacterium]|nr:AtpZ/AtpI family protein [Azospirillaceae bacterium]
MDLDARLHKARERNATGKSTSDPNALPTGPIGIAVRLGVELLAALIVGVGAGLLVDRWLGSAPWGLIGMFVLGSAAGIVNVYRVVNGIGYAPGYRKDKTPSQGRDVE